MLRTITVARNDANIKAVIDVTHEKNEKGDIAGKKPGIVSVFFVYNCKLRVTYEDRTTDEQLQLQLQLIEANQSHVYETLR